MHTQRGFATYSQSTMSALCLILSSDDPNPNRVLTHLDAALHDLRKTAKRGLVQLNNPASVDHGEEGDSAPESSKAVLARARGDRKAKPSRSARVAPAPKLVRSPMPSTPAQDEALDEKDAPVADVEAGAASVGSASSSEHGTLDHEEQGDDSDFPSTDDLSHVITANEHPKKSSADYAAQGQRRDDRTHATPLRQPARSAKHKLRRLCSESVVRIAVRIMMLLSCICGLAVLTFEVNIDAIERAKLFSVDINYAGKLRYMSREVRYRNARG